MNDAVREYASLIKGIEQELTDLKTAHQRPLGALNFFTRSISFAVQLESSYGVYTREFQVAVTIELPTVIPPIVQAGWDTPAGFYRVDFLNLTISGDYTTWVYRLSLLSDSTSAATMKFSALSSQPISNITWSYI